MRRRLVFLTLFYAALCPGLSYAVESDTQAYRKAFAALDAGHAEQAARMARRGPDRVLNKVLLAAYMAQPGNDVSFDDMADFIARNPDWPDMKGILAIAEQKIPSSFSARQVIGWFTAHPPVTLAGFYRAVDALNAAGQTQDLQRLIRARWVEGDFTTDDLAIFSQRFDSFLDSTAHRQRLDRLLWKNDAAGVKRMHPYIDSSLRALAEARLALANENSNALVLADRVPSSLDDDPGLLYELLRWDRKNNEDERAADRLRRAPLELAKPEAWWEERHIIIRRMMERRDYRTAYRLAADHGQLDNKTLTQAEFLAGWLALRFLNRPDDARSHFQALYSAGTTPITRARGAYWLGRTLEALGSKAEAEQAYETAASLNVTYYGQLATTRLYARPVIRALPEPAIPARTRSNFFDRDNIRAIEHLYAIGEKTRARSFFRAASDAATQRADFALLMELAYQIKRPDLAIEAAKAANQKNMLIEAGGFPVLDHALPIRPEPAFIHALIRQESMFRPDAESPAGAVGLMQLMPGTAQAVAKKHDIKFRKTHLNDPAYNLRLGTAFIRNQLDSFDGSYVLALSAYNAGPRRAREWVEEFGDPRDPNIDPIDWVEHIPIGETRNYVQRIIEGLQMYRARLSGGQAPLTILADLKR
ncbi:MAG: lytic transglycosylase domain-containing protein [Alphaproteobacteria bacterium]|nr:lytic transglycosylase domain-containing protein [Alphaproteobacteria bacterium]